jgi:hypothetical protein
VPITVLALPKARNIFARSNFAIVDSNPAPGMDVCVFYVSVVLCAGSGLGTGLIPRPRSPTDCV